MSDDTISRQAAIDAIQQHREDVLGGYKYDEGVAFVYAAAHNHIIRVIKQLPSAERRGRWDNGFCSVCGAEALTEWNDTGGEYAFTKFCPNCGAKMDGEEE